MKINVEDFINSSYFEPYHDIFIYSYKDYDDVLNEVSDTGKELYELDDAYFLACFKSRMYYKTRSFLKKELNEAEIINFAFFQKRQVALFIDWNWGKKLMNRPKYEDYKHFDDNQSIYPYCRDLENYCDYLEKLFDKACVIIFEKDFALTKDIVYTKEQWKEYLLKDEN